MVNHVIYELMLRIPIFPGANEIDQLSKNICCIRYTWYSTENEWKHAQILPKYRTFETKTKFPLRTLFHAASNNDIDLFEQLMKFDPNQRIDVKGAISHKYFIEDRDSFYCLLLKAHELSQCLVAQVVERRIFNFSHKVILTLSYIKFLPANKNDT